jgi:hypothetical protein
MQINILIGIAGTLLGIVFGYLGFKRNTTNDLKQDTKEDTKAKVEMNTKLDVLLKYSTETKDSIKEIEKKFDVFKDEVNVRLTRVEESCKQAHKRIDGLEK